MQPIGRFLVLLALTAAAQAQSIQPKVLRQSRALFFFREARLDTVATGQFHAGQGNVLVLHGWQGTPSDAVTTQLLRFAASRYCNVLVYQYPSGGAIQENAGWLARELSNLLVRWVEDPATNPNRSEITFDMLAYSEGGLVARAALEAATTVGKRSPVANLVTIATPHLGLENYLNLADWQSFLGFPGQSLASDYPGLGNMLRPSLFLDALNQGCDGRACQPDIRYFAVAGLAPDLIKGVLPDPFGDGVVSLDSAVGKGSLTLAADPAVLPLFHSTELDPEKAGGRSMPCHADVYGAVGGWLFKKPAEGTCASLAGDWNVKEKVEVRCIIDGETETESATAEAPVTMAQDSCTAIYGPPAMPGKEWVRTGSLEGNYVTFTGQFMSFNQEPGLTIDIARNLLTAKGTLCGGKLSLYGTAIAEGIISAPGMGISLSFSCTGTTTAAFKRSEGAAATQGGTPGIGLAALKGALNRALARRRPGGVR